MNHKPKVGPACRAGQDAPARQAGPTRTGKIRTRTSMAHEAQTAHSNCFSLGSLELKRTICEMVRTAATKRVAEMDQRLAEIDRQQAELMQSIDAVRASRGSGPLGPPATGEADPADRRRFTLKY